MLSYHATGCLHLGQWDPGETIDSSAGNAQDANVGEAADDGAEDEQGEGHCGEHSAVANLEDSPSRKQERGPGKRHRRA